MSVQEKVFSMLELFDNISEFLDYKSAVRLGTTTQTACVYSKDCAKRRVDRLFLINEVVNERFMQKYADYFPNTEALCFKFCSFSSSPDLIARKFKNLKSLKIIACTGVDDDLDELRVCSQLAQLTISNGKNIHGKFLEKAPRSIKELNLYGCSIKDGNLQNLDSYMNLKQLDLSFNEHVHDFSSLPTTLQRLELEGCQLEDSSIRSLSQLVSLANLNMSDNENLTGATFHNLPMSLTRIEFINSSNTSYDACNRLAHLTNLQKLEISLSHRLRTVPPEVLRAAGYRKKDIPKCPII
jgi:hypothetical protein